jgi:hypothetical protein
MDRRRGLEELFVPMLLSKLLHHPMPWTLRDRRVADTVELCQTFFDLSGRPRNPPQIFDFYLISAILADMARIASVPPCPTRTGFPRFSTFPQKLDLSSPNPRPLSQKLDLSASDRPEEISIFQYLKIHPQIFDRSSPKLRPLKLFVNSRLRRFPQISDRSTPNPRPFTVYFDEFSISYQAS